MTSRPLIGITCDTGVSAAGSPRVLVAMTYIDAVSRAGGMPILLPPIVEDVDRHVGLCAGILAVGGDDPDVRAFGHALHPAAQVMSPRRQAYDLALLAALDKRPSCPLLGVCLGMQLMGLHAGGTINQHLPDTLGIESAERHRRDAAHAVKVEEGEAEVARRLGVVAGTVASNHHQALTSAGRLRVLARSDDGVVEAIGDPERAFYLGVQWHPERTPDRGLGDDLIGRFVEAARAAAWGRGE